jgi:Max protein
VFVGVPCSWIRAGSLNLGSYRTTSKTALTICGAQSHYSKERMASRAQILGKATEYIQYMQRKNHKHQQDIDDLKRQDALLEQQVRALEKARSSAQLQTNYPSSDNRVALSPSSMWVQTPAQRPSLKSPSRKKLPMEAS